MKKIIIIKGLFCLLQLASLTSFGQDFQGKAYYQSKTEVKLSDFSGRPMNDEQKQQFAQLMKDFFSKDYVLLFNAFESIYKEVEQLEKPRVNTNIGRKLGIFLDGPQYKNLKTKEFLQSQEFLGKQFLIKDKLLELTWQLHTEKKQIGTYACYKATAIKQTNSINWRNVTKGTDENNKEEPEEVIVTAWYTLDIPINQGPSEYSGLPGLILEVNFDTTTILCTKIIMNPKDGIQVKKPQKGDVVTRQKYKGITTRKLEEMKSRNSRRRSSNRKN